uniref:Uncharacterized protein n=2 Tax=Candidatus Kentrum sp. DK TaxID=2126562 RepID=A0A450TH06_9GAMM|nr:MAG: hypothetical protein BECKDK2373C_GA0170839_114910 [Candidatus Kentron sp. DK]
MERGTRSLSDLGVRREGKRDRDQNLCKFEANSGLFNEDLRGFWPISAFPQQNHPTSDRLLGNHLRKLTGSGHRNHTSPGTQ